MKEKSIAHYGKQIMWLSGIGLAAVAAAGFFITLSTLSSSADAVETTQAFLHIAATGELPMRSRALLALASFAYWFGYGWALLETWRLGRTLQTVSKLDPRLVSHFQRLSAALLFVGIGEFVVVNLPRWVARQHDLAFDKPDYYGALLIAMIAGALCDCISRLLKQGTDAQTENEGFV